MCLLTSSLGQHAQLRKPQTWHAQASAVWGFTVEEAVPRWMSQYHMSEHMGLTLDLLRFMIERQPWQPCILCYIACFSPGCRLSMDIAKYCTAMPGLLQHGMHPALRLV